MNYTPSDGEREAIKIIQSEKTNWEEGLVWVTDRVQFVMRNVILKARKNYFGFYTEPKDPITGRDKIFVPFTEWVVETMLKNIDIDTKDIETKAKTPNSYLKALIFRYVLKKKLEDINFGATINDLLRRVCIDGTGILKAEEIDGKLSVKVVDRLNMYFDPSVDSLSQSTGKIERYILTKPEFDQLNLDNGEFVKGETTVQKFDNDINNSDQEIPLVEVYQRCGWFPRYCLTENENDKETFFYGKAIVSQLNNNPVFHSLEEIKEDENPYQDFKLKKIPNRMDGRGIPEMLFNIQAYLNELINYRLNKGRIVHLGLFKMKGDITPQQFKRLFTTGGIKLGQADDIEPLITGSIDPSSYKDEEQAYMWGNRVTGTNQEDEVAGNRPATNALIQQQGNSKGYNLRIEDLALDLGLFIKDKMLPIIKKELKREMKKDKSYFMRITGDPKIMEKLDRKLAENAVYSMINNLLPSEKAQITPEVMEMMIQEAITQVAESGEDRFIPLVDELLDTDFDVSVSIGDEQINKAALASMLKETLGVLASSGLPIRNTLKELYDVLGLDGENLIQDMPEIPMMAGQPGQPMPQTETGTMQQAVMANQ